MRVSLVSGCVVLSFGRTGLPLETGGRKNFELKTRAGGKLSPTNKFLPPFATLTSGFLRIIIKALQRADLKSTSYKMTLRVLCFRIRSGS